MAYGDLSVFLPRAEGDVLDTERARAEGASKAAYLSQMDQFYKGLEESARQFDLQQALSERQFEWQSGFEETKLAQEAEIEKNRLEVEKLVAEGQASYWEGQLELGKGELSLQRELGRGELALARREQNFMQDYYRNQFELEERRFGLEEDLAYGEMGKTSYPTYTPAGAYSGMSGQVKDLRANYSSRRTGTSRRSSNQSSSNTSPYARWF